MPGLHGKAGFSYEKIMYLWRNKEKKKDTMIGESYHWRPNLTYDVRLRVPHEAISGILGGTFAASFWDRGNAASAESLTSWEVLKSDGKIGALSADLLGSVCVSLQLGRFKNLIGNLTRLDARLDMCSATALAKRRCTSGSAVSNEDHPSAFPKLNLILQQQVIGPIMFRVDSRFSLDISPEKQDPQMELELLIEAFTIWESGRLVFSKNKRGNGGVELVRILVPGYLFL